MSDATNVLRLDVDPALSGFHHATAVQSSEAKPMVHVVTASVHCPAIFLGVWDASRLHDDVLNVTPRQVTTATDTNQIKLGFILCDQKLTYNNNNAQATEFKSE